MLKRQLNWRKKPMPFLPFAIGMRIAFIRVFSIITLNLLLSISIRILYQFLYDYTNRHTNLRGPLWHLIGFASGLSVVGDKTVTVPTSTNEKTKIKIAIVGAGHAGCAHDGRALRTAARRHGRTRG